MAERRAGRRAAAPVALGVLMLLAAPAPGAAATATVAAAAPRGTDAEGLYRHTLRAGDTLIGLSRRLLADPARWREVARANALRNPDRIPTGGTLLIPWALMRVEPGTAEVLQVAGRVEGSGAAGAAAPLRPGQVLAEGSEVRTADDGQAVLRLVDGTLLRPRGASTLRVVPAHRVPAAGVVRSGSELDAGRVEVQAEPAAAGKPGFRIRTPQGVLAVRGTEFRVQVEPGRTRGEVVGGVVAVGEVPVAAGFGSAIDAAGAVSPPRRLLPAPPLEGLPALQERVLVRFALPALPGVVRWRAQVRPADAAVLTTLADMVVEGAELRVPGLDDGALVLTLRGVDAAGFEGLEATHAFRLKARPEAPLPLNPQPGATIVGSAVSLSWATHPQARSYRLQLAADERFTQGLREWNDLAGTTQAIEGLAFQRWHWRVRTVRAAEGRDDPGPWGDARSFELRPPPPQPQPPRISDNRVQLAWTALPGQTFDVQVARDAAFAQLVFDQRLQQPQFDAALPGPGRYHVRLRAREADGFVGPYSEPQTFEVIDCVRDAGGRCVESAGQPLRSP